MADRRGDAKRQHPFSSAQERVFDGGGGSGGTGQPFGSDFDHGSSYMSLLGAGVNPQPPPWAVEEVTTAPPTINLTPQFSVANYAPSSSHQQSASFLSPLAAGSLHPYPSYLHADPPPQWPPRAAPLPSSLPPRNFAILPAASPHEQHMHMQLLRAAALGGAGAGPQASASAAAAPPPIEQPAKDGYNWRKYGQKQLKDAESPRSYYKCTRDGCPVKKIVERSFDGCIKEITYKGRHSHPRPPEPRPGGHAGATRGGDDVATGAGAGAEVEDVDEPSDDDALHEDDGEEGHGRGEGGAAGQRVVKKHKIILQTPSEFDLLDDGYRWRKYGQKVVKGNPRPRSYYKCIAENCNVRKQIERASTDPKCVLTTYTGRHSHDPPGRGTGAAAAGASSADPMPSTVNSARGTYQQSSGTRQLKEESRD